MIEATALVSFSIFTPSFASIAWCNPSLLRGPGCKRPFNESTIITSPSNEILECPLQVKAGIEVTESKVVSRANSINVYPSVAKNSISIATSLDISSVNIINNIGNLVLTLNEPSLNHIDISSLSSGIYFVSVSTKNGSTVTKKIVKN